MDMLTSIGNTPLIHLKNLSKEAGANIYVKAEMRNPGGSIKDRASLAYVKDALATGTLTQDGTVIEATSGNLGIGLAVVCAELGIRLIVCMPESASIERRKLMQGLGAEIILTPANKGMSGAQEKAEELYNNSKNAFRPNQFSNPIGPKAHYESTGPEIRAQAMQEKISIDAFVAGAGSGATFMGVGKYLKEYYPLIFLGIIEPEESAVLSGKPAAPHGIQGIGAGFVPDIVDKSLITEILTVNTRTAKETARKALKTDALNGGISTGANIAAALELSKRKEFQGKNIVTIACDTGERYMSTDLFIQE